MSFTNMTRTASSGDFDEIKQIALAAQTIATSNQSLIATKAAQIDVTTSLSLKQNVIVDGDLQISHVSNLLTNLDLKADLQTVTNALNTKQYVHKHNHIKHILIITNTCIRIPTQIPTQLCDHK